MKWNGKKLDVRINDYQFFIPGRECHTSRRDSVYESRNRYRILYIKQKYYRIYGNIMTNLNKTLVQQ